MRGIATVCAMVALCMMAATCGQRGPLYLPEDAPEAQTRLGTVSDVSPFRQ